ncbi:MAG: Na(+)-translocating NADH-quinone reductase subunit A [Flavobacteriales bacterium]|nr:Na(+)-translocating NADH-quinone reductase subunit A [Flavobacteriales bacterium]
MSKSIKIRKGADIRLAGEAQLKIDQADTADVYALRPPNFHGLVPKLCVKAGEQVKAGEPLFFDKSNENIMFCSPVSGEVAEVVRGEKRRILEVRVLADRSNDYKDMGAVKPSSLKLDDLKAKMLDAGLWPFMRQRPYDIVANPHEQPKAIFISGFDSAPLAPDADFVMKDKMADFQAGIDALKVLADGKKVHLSYKKGSTVLKATQGVELHEIDGPHPAGNVGVQIHHINPINKGEVVWYVNYQDVANIGRVLTSGKFDIHRTVAFTGANMSDAKYYNVRIGACLKKELTSQVNTSNTRIISGNVLTGETIANDGFLGYFDQQVTAIPEGNEPLFMLTKGWLSLGFDKFSLSKSYPTWILPKNKKFNLTTNSNGEERAFVVTGQYEKVFPFDIYPVQLVKSILVNDIDRMEQLGIYEVGPEDFALCEYVCTSKIDVQNIVRNGLDVLRAES